MNIKLYKLLFVLLTLEGCDKESFDEGKDNLTKYPTEMQSFIISFSHLQKAWTDQNAEYEAWPLGQLWYDTNCNKVCQVYNSRNSHVDLQNGNVLFRNKDELGKWSKPIIVASWKTDKISKRCHGAGVCANGDYIALVVHEEKERPYGNIFLYRSNNLGYSWINEGAIVIDGEPLFVSESSCVFKTFSNRLLSYASIGLGRNTACVIFSDDNGVSWKKSLMPDGMGFLEGTFIQMENSDIYCIARQVDNYCYPNSPQMSYSSDNGDSWIYLGDTCLRSTDAPVAQLRVDNYVYMLYGDRWPNQRGNMTLRFNWMTSHDYKLKLFNDYDVVISEVNCSYPDFSYPALVETPNTIQGTFYCRGEKNVGIFEMIATKPNI